MIKNARISRTDNGYHASISFTNAPAQEQTFGSFYEANDWLISMEQDHSAIPEPQPDKITEEEAAEFNAQVNPAPKPVGAVDAALGQDQTEV